ncbi:MAG TPA: right-handed parallel beta-helix repeat-containing protein [Saprospiraceae bacterium]|nr:right-handed parallel beta-helix repeat-containing protein [Saprospiraceae bacterium]
MKKSTKLILPFLLFGNFIFAQILYVKFDAVGTGNGSSWANAYINIQDAINTATSGTQIWVSQGTYKPTKDPFGASSNMKTLTFYLKNGVALYGGFDGTEMSLAERTLDNPTILSGQLGANNASKVNHVVLSVHDNANTILDGFIVENAYCNGLFGITVEGVAINATMGAGIAAYNSSMIIRNTIVRNNEASVGGGIFTENSNTTILNSQISNNSGIDGGGITYVNSGGTIRNSRINNNSGGDGGAMCIAANSNPVFTNCDIYSNSGYGDGGAIYSDFGNPTFVNCSFSGNTSSGSGGTLYSNGGTSTAIFRNCIIWGNVSSDPFSIIKSNGNNLSVTYSIVQGPSIYPGTGNSNADPQFVAGPSNLHLMPISPAIDAGLSSGAPADDIDGNTRPQGSGIDMGAHEFILPSMLVFEGPGQLWSTHSNWNMGFCPPANFSGTIMIDANCTVPTGSMSQLHSGVELKIMTGAVLTVE